MSTPSTVGEFLKNARVESQTARCKIWASDDGLTPNQAWLLSAAEKAKIAMNQFPTIKPSFEDVEWLALIDRPANDPHDAAQLVITFTEWMLSSAAQLTELEGLLKTRKRILSKSAPSIKKHAEESAADFRSEYREWSKTARISDAIKSVRFVTQADTAQMLRLYRLIVDDGTLAERFPDLSNQLSVAVQRLEAMSAASDADRRTYFKEAAPKIKEAETVLRALWEETITAPDFETFLKDEEEQEEDTATVTNRSLGEVIDSFLKGFSRSLLRFAEASDSRDGQRVS